MGATSSQESLSDNLQSLVEKFHLELRDKLQRHHQSVNGFSQDFFKWMDKTNDVIASFEDVVEDFKKHHRNANIASLTGSSTSLVGGAACIAGLALAPFTGGVSMALTAGGLIGTTAGTLTSSGARCVEFGLKRTAFKELSALIDDQCQETLKLATRIETCKLREQEVMNFLENNEYIAQILSNNSVLDQITNDEMKEIVEKIKNGCATSREHFMLINFLCSRNFYALESIRSLKLLSLNTKVLEKTFHLALSLRSTIKDINRCTVILKNMRAGISAVQVASKGARFAKGALIGLSIATDLYEICTTAKEMAAKASPEEVESLNKVVSELREQKNEVTELYVFLDNMYTGN